MQERTKRSTSADGAGARTASKAPRASKPGRGAADTSRTEPATPKAGRSKELRFKVTEAVKQSFKATAKDLGIKKGVLLERLLADWQARHPPAGRAAKLAPDSGDGGARPAAKPARDAKPRSRNGSKPARP